MKALAQLEAMRTKVQLAEEEAKLRKEKARLKHEIDLEHLDADLSVLKLHREAADLESEIRVVSIIDEVEEDKPPSIGVPTDRGRTERYITEHYAQEGSRYDMNPDTKDTEIPATELPRDTCNYSPSKYNFTREQFNIHLPCGSLSFFQTVRVFG